MEQSNKIQRSEVWEKIYKVVKQIPTKEVDGDCMDAPSATTEIEELFLKLLPIQHVSKMLRESENIYATAYATTEEEFEQFLRDNYT